MFMTSLLFYIQLTYGGTYIHQDMGEIYWPAMNIEEEPLERVEKKRAPATEVEKKKNIEDLQSLVDVCWYRCIFEVED